MPCLNCNRNIMKTELKTQIMKMSSGFNRSQIAAMLGIHKQEVDKVLDAPVVEEIKVKKEDK